MAHNLIWHYAVLVGEPYYKPACWVGLESINTPMSDHGMTIVRGDVDCDVCKKMMGMV